MRSVLRCALPFLPLLMGCREGSMAPARPPLTGPAGLMEITITGIGTPQQKTSARSLSAPAAVRTVPGGLSRGARIIQSGRLSTLPDTSATVDGTVQITPVSTASFTWGTRTGGGYRYVSATYKVRNASDSGMAYGDDRTNLTFLAVSTPSTLNGTAISVLRKFDNSLAASGLELQVTPTGWADLSSTATLTARTPDVLQVYTETEVTPVPAGVTSIQPYGFVVRNPSTANSRTLVASPDTAQFDGLVTFAFKVPLQGLATNDPFTITAVFLPMDDNLPVVTQSFEEADATSVTAVTTRASTLTATLRSLIGVTVGTTAATHVCAVRSAGTAGSPVAFLVDSIAVASESPDPYGSGGSFVSTTPTISATFSKTMSGASAATFVVNSRQKGRMFVGGSYSGAGTAALGAPAGSFLAGDVLEVALTGLTGSGSGARLCTPAVYRYRIAGASASAAYAKATGSPFVIGAGTGPFRAALGDVNGDGKLDVVTANFDAGSVTVLLGDGTGGFTVGSPITAGIRTNPFGIVLADVNGDGKLDMVVSNEGSSNVSVLIGDGSGGFAPASKSPFSVGAASFDLVVGDVNGDGNLDIVSASSGAHTVTVLLGDGTGNFTAAPGSPISPLTAEAGFGIALGDVNNDGKLDIIVPNSSLATGTVTVLLGNGQGQFTADPSGPFAVDSGPNSVVVADFNGDGKPDLAVGNEFKGTVSILIGDGLGGFTLTTTLTLVGLPSNILYLAVGDFNGDGKLDIAAPIYQGFSTNNKLEVWLGDGSGGFTQKTGSPFTVGINPGSVAVGDVNGDGKLDLVTGNRNFGGTGSVSVMLNP